jgi:hypothetical protein
MSKDNKWIREVEVGKQKVRRAIGGNMLLVSNMILSFKSS